MGRTSADAIRNHAAGQARITHYCSCGRVVRGNPGWWSHRNANPDHTSITTSQWNALPEDRKIRS